MLCSITTYLWSICINFSAFNNSNSESLILFVYLFILYIFCFLWTWISMNWVNTCIWIIKISQTCTLLVGLPTYLYYISRMFQPIWTTIKEFKIMQVEYQDVCLWLSIHFCHTIICKPVILTLVLCWTFWWWHGWSEKCCICSKINCSSDRSVHGLF